MVSDSEFDYYVLNAIIVHILVILILDSIHVSYVGKDKYVRA